MARKQSYWQQLKDPRWQRMRLEILQRENFACQACRGTELTLHVHHTYYEKGHAPWEYPRSSLMVLCEACHEWHHTQRAELDQAIGALKADVHALERVMGYVTAMLAEKEVEEEPRASYIEAGTLQLPGIADFFGITEQDVWRNRDADENESADALAFDFFHLRSLDPRRQG